MDYIEITQTGEWPLKFNSLTKTKEGKAFLLRGITLLYGVCETLITIQ